MPASAKEFIESVDIARTAHPSAPTGAVDTTASAVDTMRRSGALFLSLRGASMAPALWPGDMVRARPVRYDDIRIGDIVVFSQAGQLITHRVIARGDALHTQGDASARVDAPVLPEQLLGAVDLVLRGGVSFSPPRRPGAPHRIAATLLRHAPLLSRIAQRLRAMLLQPGVADAAP